MKKGKPQKLPSQHVLPEDINIKSQVEATTCAGKDSVYDHFDVSSEIDEVADILGEVGSVKSMCEKQGVINKSNLHHQEIE